MVVDDGSGDGTARIVQAMALQDKRIRLLQQPNAGVAAARNLAIQASNGVFIAPIDADDIWYPQNIERQVHCLLQADMSVGLVYAHSVDIDENDQLIGTYHSSEIAGEVFTFLLLHYFIANASSTLIRRTSLEKAGFYDGNFREQKAQGCEDWDLFLRIAERYQFEVVPEFVVAYRKLPDSMSGDHATMARSQNLIWQSIQTKYPGIPKRMRSISTASFYMYLGYENNRCSKHRQALDWLHKALHENFVTLFVCPTFYTLLIKSWFYLLVPAKYINTLNIRVPQGVAKRKRIQTLEKLNRQKTLHVKTLAEKVLHQLASRIFGTAKDWH